MNAFSGRADGPRGIAALPKRRSRKRQVNLLRFMGMRGIFGIGGEQENSTGDPVTVEYSAPADPFAPAVALQETLAKIAADVGLPPFEMPCKALDVLNKDVRRGHGEAPDAVQGVRDRERFGNLWPRCQMLRPIRVKSTRGPFLGSNQSVRRSDKGAQVPRDGDVDLLRPCWQVSDPQP